MLKMNRTKHLKRLAALLTSQIFAQSIVQISSWHFAHAADLQSVPARNRVVGASEASDTSGVREASSTEKKPDLNVSCTVSSLTRGCDFFREREAEGQVRLKDGTEFRNPLSKQRRGTIATPSQAETVLKAQNQALKSWQKLSGNARVTDEFKIAFSNSLGNAVLGEALGEKPPSGQPAFLNATPSLPWPANQSGAKPRKVSREELNAFIAKLPSQVRGELRAAVQLYRGVNVSERSPLPAVAASDRRVISVERSLRLMELAAFARSTLIDEIKGDRASDRLTLEERAQIEKIRTIRVRSPEEVADNLNCAGPEPDAVNNPITHSIGICPSFAGYPDSQLVFLFAHEMAHAIDPCYREFPLLRINRDKLAMFTPSELPKELSDNLDRSRMYQQLRSLPNAAEYTNFEALFVAEDPQAVQFFIERGIVSESAPGFSSDRDPSSKAYSCLRDRGDFRETRLADIESFAAAYAEALDEKSESGIDKVVIRKRLSGGLTRYPQCSPSLLGGSQMGEVMADAWGAKVLGRWLEKNPPQSEVEKIAAISTFAEDVCASANAPKSEAENQGLRTSRALMERVASASKEIHPRARTRLNEVILTDSRMQVAFACQGVTKQSCLAWLGGDGSVRLTPNIAPDVVPGSGPASGSGAVR